MYLHPLTIGSLTLPHHIMFAPMAGVSDLPFRLLCHEQGSAMGVTELISAKAITYRNRNTYAMLETHPDEGPVAIQLFGSEPDVFAEAIRLILTFRTERRFLPPDGSDRKRCHDAGKFRQKNGTACLQVIDINMGCPVPKVVSNGEGSALMKNPRLIEEIVRACVKAAATDNRAEEPSRCPCHVTVKLRSGFDKHHVNAVECALAAEAGGASMITVHARTRDQMYSGRADWQVIRAVKEAVKVPVTGNGDVTDGDSAKRMFEETGCDGIMIARAAQGNPWVFREVIHALRTGETLPRPDACEIRDMIRRHFDLLIQHKGEYTAVREMRKHIGWYTAGLPGASRMRDEVNRTATKEALNALCDSYFGALIHTIDRA
ncbi:MAG: tRNA-dihydrouridine synthase [Lachnospiraceae bacterium]|nr:tRNA-dihydrouridine synthase [Lachnospiraceae bacterium]